MVSMPLEAKSKLQLRSGALRLAFSQRPSMQKAPRRVAMHGMKL